MNQTQARGDFVDAALDRWLVPFLAAFKREAQCKWAPIYLRGLIGGGDRKSVEPIALRVAPGETQQLHHFISTSPWATEPLEKVLAQEADRLIGGDDAFLIVDDTAVVKKGEHSVGVAHQYCGELGKKANCQALVSLTLARNEIPIPVALRLYLPESWTEDRERCDRARVPSSIVFRTKHQIALEEIDRLRACGVRFSQVLADAGYGSAAEFRQGLTKRGIAWTVGITSSHNVYPADVKVTMPENQGTGRPPKHPVTDVAPSSAEKFIRKLGKDSFTRIAWRYGTKGTLSGDFAFVRVRVADGREARSGVHLPGPEVWLICERRSNELKYYLSSHGRTTSRRKLVTFIKSRWACEQGHQQMKEELGLDHLECRSWVALHHHAIMTMMAFAFLQTMRLQEKKRFPTGAADVAVSSAYPAPHHRQDAAMRSMSRLCAACAHSGA